MNSLRPGVVAISILAVLSSAFIVWKLSESPGENNIDSAQRATRAASSAAIARPESQAIPAQKIPGIQPQEVPSVLADRVAKKTAQKARRSAKLREEAKLERQTALERLNELKYPDSDARRIADHWDEAFNKADAEIAQIELEQGRIAGQHKGLIYGEAHRTLRDLLGDDEYTSARYAYGLSTWVGPVNIYPNTPAGKAGVLPGDQLYSYNGELILTIADHSNRQYSEPPGSVAEICFLRASHIFCHDFPNGNLGVALISKSTAP